MEDSKVLVLINSKDQFREWVYQKAKDYVDLKFCDINYERRMNDFIEGAFTVWELFKNNEL